MRKEQVWADFLEMCAIYLLVLNQFQLDGDGIKKQLA